MKKLIFLLMLMIVGLTYTACKKKSQNVAAPAALPAVKTDTVLPNNPKVVSHAYPYTDTFPGSLYLSYTAHDVPLHDTTIPYLFYVLHVNKDSVVFISSDTIYQCPGALPNRFFYNGYAVVSTNTYPFKNFCNGDDGEYTYPANDNPGFVLSDSTLRVGWSDIYADECRLSSPAGGVEITMSNCSYIGTLPGYR